MKRRVVITGIGPVTSIGTGKDDFTGSVFNLKTNIIPIPESWNDKYRFKSRYYVPAPKISLSDFGIPASLEAVMEEISKFSAAGAKLALVDAGFNIEDGERYFKIKDLEEGGVIVGVGMSSLQTAFNSYIAHTGYTEESFKDSHTAHKFNRMVIPMLMPNSAAAWISILFGIKGPSHTLNASCASGSFAIGEAYNKIKDGYFDTAITGGVEALSEESGSIMRGFDMLSTLTRSENGKPQPFSANRSGFLFNSGAGCILVLEELNAAKKRGANIYAEIAGFECNSDGYNIAQIEPSGAQIVSLLEKTARDKKLDYINAHGTGTVPNDEIEARSIQKVFGSMDTQPFINSTKGILGHSIGASGALEAAVAAFSIKNSRIHGNLTDDPMDNLNLPLKTTECSIGYAVSLSYGFGGHNAALLFRRYNDNE